MRPAILGAISSGSSIDPATQDYITRVQGQGGTVSEQVRSAVNDFLLSAKSHGYFTTLRRASLYRNANDIASLVPLIDDVGGATDTNNGTTFASNIGRVGGGSAYIDSGYTPTEATGGVSVILSTTQTSNTTTRIPVGTRSTDSSRVFRIAGNSNGEGTSTSGAVNGSWGGLFIVGTPQANTTGGLIAAHWHMVRTSSTAAKLYRNGAEVGSMTSSITAQTPSFPFFIFANNAAGTANAFLESGSTIAWVGFDSGMTAQQAADYNADLAVLMEALTAPVSPNATAATVARWDWLKDQMGTAYAFGTNDMLSTMPPTTLAFYGTAGVFQANSGKYPGCVGFEYHDEEWTSRYGATATAATKTAIQAAHAAGAIILLHHHAGNPVTGALSAEGTLSTFNNPFGQAGDTGNVYDRDGSPVAAIKTGGGEEAQFLAYLDRLAAFLASLTDAGGNLIPVIFRPFHECNGNWFWWNGTDRAADLILVWQKMVAYLRDTKGVTNVLYCWNVDAGPGSIGSFWPGPSYVDVISMDVYDNTANSTASLARQGTTVTAYNDLVSRAATHSKPLIFAEVGYSYGAQNISDIWDVKTGDILTASFPQCSLLAVWRSPFGPGSSDSANIKTSLTNMANSPEALTAGEV